MNEIYPLEKAPEAYERMMSGAARFRAVLTTGIATLMVWIAYHVEGVIATKSYCR